MFRLLWLYHSIFLSTPSARRATAFQARGMRSGQNFYPRPPRGGRHSAMHPSSFGSLFLSTPSARRATSAGSADCAFRSDFYPRPPRGGRRVCSVHLAGFAVISIHALREEGDSASVCGASVKSYFYPRPPRGGRRLSLYSGISSAQFLSTPSARRATHALARLDLAGSISIHALREEGDPCPVS